MTEAVNICHLAQSVLQEHRCHPHYHRIGLSGIQGVEAVLTILQDCYGWSYPGGLFLAAVDLLLEKQPVVWAVKQQLQRCMEAGHTAQKQKRLQEQQSTADSQAGSSSGSHQTQGRLSQPASNSASGTLPLQHDSEAEAEAAAVCSSADNMQQLLHDDLQAQDSSDAEQSQEQDEQASGSPAGAQSEAPAEHSTPAARAQSWQAGTSPASADQQCSSRSVSMSPADASTASGTRSRSSTPATPPAAQAGALGLPFPKSGSSSKPYAAPGLGGNPIASPASAVSPIQHGAAARLAQQQHQRVRMMDSFQRHQHQQLQQLLFGAPSEVFTASLAGSMRQIDLSAMNSPHQIQAQQELQQELSRSSMASTAAPNHSSQQQWQLLQAEAEQQQMLPLPQKAQEQQQLQETLQFARQPVQLPPSPVSTWQQWQQQQQLERHGVATPPAAAAAAAAEASPWRIQQLQQQHQEQNAASPLAVPQPKHKQPPLSPPVLPPHTASPAVTPLLLPLRQAREVQTCTDEQPPHSWQQAQSAAQDGPSPQPQQQPQQQQHQQQTRHRSPQQQQEQLQDLHNLAGILQPVLYDDAAASEVLSEWLSGSDVAVASDTGSDAAMGPGFVFQPSFMVPMQPSSAASTAGAAMAASPPVMPHMLHFTPVAAAAGGSAGWQGRQGVYSGDRSGVQYASPAPGSVAAGATPSAAARLQQQWQQGTPSTAAAAQGHRDANSTGCRTVGSSVARGPPAHATLSPGSSITVQRATAAEGDDQSLVLDIDLAKVLDSSGTIVLQVRRDETGALTAAAALAPAATPAGTKRAAAAAAAEVGAAAGPLAAASPVIGSKERQEQQGLPFGSISVDGSIGAAWGAAQLAAAKQHEQQQQQQREGYERPLHRVLRYSAEGRVSIGSFGSAGPGSRGGALAESVDVPAIQQQQQQLERDAEDALQVVCAPRGQQLGNSSWVLVDIQPAAQPAAATDAVQERSAGSSAEAAMLAQQSAEDTAATAPIVVKDVLVKESELPSPCSVHWQQQQQQDSAWQQQGLHPHQQAMLQGQHGPRTQRVSLEPPSTPLAGSMAGALLNMQPSDSAEARQSSAGGHGTPVGAEDSATTFADLAGGQDAAAAEAATPPPAAALTPAAARSGGSAGGEAGTGQSTSPVAPELLPTETPAGFKFWAGGRAAAGGGLRYNAAQQTLESLSNLLVAADAEAAAAEAEHSSRGQHPGTGDAAAGGVDVTQAQRQQQQLLQLGLLGQSLELLGLNEADLGQLGLAQISLDLLGMGQMQSMELQMLQALGAAAGAGGAGNVPAARALAVSAVKLLRQSLAAAAAVRQRTPAPKQQQGPSGLAAAAAAAALMLNNTQAYQSLELLPRQLQQSLQAAAAEGASSQAQLMAAAAAGQQQLQEVPGGVGAVQQAAHQQQDGVHDSLTNWLADRFGTDADLQKSVSLLLQELEQQQPQDQQPQEQQQQQHGTDAMLVGSDAQPGDPGAEAAAAVGSNPTVADAVAPFTAHAAATPAAASKTAAVGSQVDPAHAQQLHDGDTSELCATASPVTAWYAALAQQQRTAADQQDHGTLAAHAAQEQQGSLQQQQQQRGAALSYDSWSNRVEQLLRATQPSPDAGSDAAEAPAVLTEGSLGMTPSPSGFCYGPHTDHGSVSAAARAGVEPVGGEGGGDTVGDLAAGANLAQGGDSVPSLFRTSVMTNPLYWVEPSTANLRAALAATTMPAAAGAGDAGLCAAPDVRASVVASNTRDWAAAVAQQMQAAAAADAAADAQLDASAVAVDAAADASAVPTEAAEQGISMGEQFLEAALPWAPTNQSTAAADTATPAAPGQQDSAKAAAILQQYLPYSSSSNNSSPASSDGGSVTRASGSAGSRDEASSEAELQAQCAPAQQGGSASPAGWAAAAGAGSDAQATARPVPVALESSQPELPALFAADSGEVGVPTSSSSATRSGEATPGSCQQQQQQELSGQQGDISCSSTGRHSSSVRVPASPRTPREVLYGSFCEAAEGLGAAASTNKYGDACGTAHDSQRDSASSPAGGQVAAAGAAAAEPTAAAASDTEFCGRLSPEAFQQTGSSTTAAAGEVRDIHAAVLGLDYLASQDSSCAEQSCSDQMLQQASLEDSAAAEGGSPSCSQDWRQQQPRWQVVSELAWAESQQQQQQQQQQHWEHAGGRGYETGQQQGLSWGPQEQQLLLEQQQHQQQYGANAESAIEPQWEQQQPGPEAHTEKANGHHLQQHIQPGQQLPDDMQQQQQQTQHEHEEQDGVYVPEPQSTSRIQTLMQKLRSRRRLQHGADGEPTQSPAPGCGRGVQRLAADADLAQTDQQESMVIGLQALPAATAAGLGATLSAQQEQPAASFGSLGLHASSPSQTGPEAPEAAAQASPSAESSGMAQGDSSRGECSGSIKSSARLDSAVEDTLSAAEEAMQQALQRLQLLQEQQQQAFEQQQVEEMQHEQQQQVVEQPGAQLQPPAAAATAWEAWDLRMQHSEGQLQMQQPSPVPSQQQEQQQCGGSLSPVDAAAADAGMQSSGAAAATAAAQQAHASAEAAQQLQQAEVAAVPHAAAAAESPSVKWVRAVLQDSSAFSSYVQAIAQGDNTQPASHALPGDSRPAGAVHGSPGHAEQGYAAAVVAAAAAADIASSGEDRVGRVRAEGLRTKVAGKMSSLWAEVQGDNLRASCSSSDSNDSIAESLGDEQDPGVPDSGAAADTCGNRQQRSVWQDKIQQLLAAADAAADSLTQPPQVRPRQQQQQQQKAGVRRPSLERTAAARLAAEGTPSSLGAVSKAAASKMRMVSGLAAPQGLGSRSQALRGSKPIKVAAAAAIVAARHTQPGGTTAAAAPATGTVGASTAVKGGKALEPHQMQKLPVAKQALPAAAEAATAICYSAGLKQSQQLWKQQQQQEEDVSSALQDVYAADAAATSSHQHAVNPQRPEAVSARRRSSFSLRSRPAKPRQPSPLPTTQQQQQQQREEQVESLPAAQQGVQPDGPCVENQARLVLQQQPELPAAQGVPLAARQLPVKGVAALAARQRDRLQQLSHKRLKHQQPQPQQELATQRRQAGAASAGVTMPPVAAEARVSSRAQSSSKHMRPEDSAVMHSPTGTYTGVPAHKSSSGKLGSVQQQLPGSLTVILAAAGRDTAVGTAAAAAAGALTAAKQAVGQKSSSMFDIAQPKGYTFSTAKARANAELACAAEPPVPEQQGASATVSHSSRGPGSKQPVSKQYVPSGRQQLTGIAAAGDVSRRLGMQQAATGGVPGTQGRSSSVTRAASPAAGAAVRGPSAAVPAASRQSVRKEAQPPAAAVTPAAPPRQSGGLQQEESFSSQRSHGLSLRKGNRQQPSPAQAAAAGKPQHQQQVAGHSRVTIHRSADVTPVSAGRGQQAQGGAERRRTGAGGVGSQRLTATGTVAAVAAVKAALAGFGTRGWQQQDVCSWLSKLRLDLLPEEHSAPLLCNPLRNGLLLAGIAAAVTQQPLPGISQPVTTLATARANLLTAAARLNLVSAQFACAAAAAAAQQDKDGALGALGPSPGLNSAKCDSPGFRGTCRASATRFSSPIRTRGRSSANSSPGKAGSYRSRSRSVSPIRAYQGGTGIVLDTSSSCGCFVVVAAGPGVHRLTGGPAAAQQHQGQHGELASVLCGPAGSCGCDCWACQQLQGSVLEHAVLQLLELVMAGDTSCMWGLLYALQQAYPVVPGVNGQGPASPVKKVGGAAGRAREPSRSPQKQRQRSQQQQQQLCVAGSVRGSGSAAGDVSSAGCVVVQPLQGPSWRSFQLPYTATELTELEQQLLQWLADLDIICAADTPEWSCLSSELSSGMLLAEVAAALGLPHAVGIQERPVTAAARAGNILAVLDVLEYLPGWHGKWLLQQHSAALTAGERPALTALLEALWVWATGQQEGPWLAWQQQQHVMGSRGSTCNSSVGQTAAASAVGACARGNRRAPG